MTATLNPRGDGVGGWAARVGHIDANLQTLAEEGIRVAYVADDKSDAPAGSTDNPVRVAARRDRIVRPTRCAVTDGISASGLATEISSTRALGWVTGPAMFGFGESAHTGGIFHLLVADGSVRPLMKDLSIEQWSALQTPDGGEAEVLP